MAQRKSGYERIPADLYQTPSWVTNALCDVINVEGKSVWEPACGEGQMVQALADRGAAVIASDIHDYGQKFKASFFDLKWQYDMVITNPPFGPRGKTAEAFIKHGLGVMGSAMALLLSVDFDSAHGRRHLFGDNDFFAGKIVLTKRIMWFKGESSPSANHAWFIWRKDVLPVRPPVLLYGP